MKYNHALFLLVLLVSSLPLAAENELSVQQIVEKMAARIDEMDLASEEWGYWQESVQKKLDSKNQIKEEETRLRRTIWLEGKPYMELVKINGENLNPEQTKEEANAKAKFLKKKDPDEDDPTWRELIQKYNYSLLSSDGEPAYLVSFRPKKSGVAERNRSDKIFNHLSGKLWIDENFDLLRVTASLTRELGFGLGVVAKLEKLEIDYRRQQYKDIWLPSSLHLQFNARMLLFKSERQIANLRFFDPYSRPKQ